MKLTYVFVLLFVLLQTSWVLAQACSGTTLETCEHRGASEVDSPGECCVWCGNSPTDGTCFSTDGSNTNGIANFTCPAQGVDVCIPQALFSRCSCIRVNGASTLSPLAFASLAGGLTGFLML